MMPNLSEERPAAGALHRGSFTLRSVQASAFVSEGFIVPRRILVRTLDEWADIYSSTPISLPFPDEFGGELPLVTLLNEANTERLEIARSRLNMYRIAGETAPLPPLGAILDEIGARLAVVANWTELSIGRLAVVVGRESPHDQPGAAIAAQFSAPRWLAGPLQGIEGFELHAHTIGVLHEDIAINSWIRIKTANPVVQHYRAIAVEQDVNTLAQDLERHRFDKAAIRNVIAAMAARMEDTFAAYFPDDEGLSNGT